MIDAPEIERLVRRAQGGDVRAFERLVAAEIPRVRRFARAFTRSEADADDLAQDALLKVYRSIGGYRFQSSFSTWLFAVTRNAFLDAAKSQAGRERTVRSSADEDHARPEAPDESFIREEERRRLWRAIGEIPSEFRTALVLFDIEGLSYEEVAAIERIALGTVKSRLSRAREHLRRVIAALDPQGEEPDAAGASVWRKRGVG